MNNNIYIFLKHCLAKNATNKKTNLKKLLLYICLNIILVYNFNKISKYSKIIFLIDDSFHFPIKTIEVFY